MLSDDDPTVSIFYPFQRSSNNICMYRWLPRVSADTLVFRMCLDLLFSTKVHVILNSDLQFYSFAAFIRFCLLLCVALYKRRNDDYS